MALRHAETTPPAPDPQSFGALVLDLYRRTVTRGTQATHLTPKDYDLLVLLADNAGRVVTNATALQRL